MSVEKITAASDFTHIEEVTTLISELQRLEVEYPQQVSTLIALLDNKSLNLGILLKRLSRKGKGAEAAKIGELVYAGVTAAGVQEKNRDPEHEAIMKRLVDEILKIADTL
jgi:hypothetical protein